MNRQEIFDKVSSHLLQQGCKALNGALGCEYLAPDGKRCAIGALIPDGHEGLGYIGDVESLLNVYEDLAQLWEVHSYEDKLFLSELQDIHDSFEPKGWGAKLGAFASRYSLDFQEHSV